MRHLEKLIWLQTIDTLWKDHLLNMDHLKEGIGLRGYGQKNPLQEYQKEGFDMFEEMIRRMEADVVEKLMSVQLQAQPAAAQAHPAAAASRVRGFRAADAGSRRRHAATPAAASAGARARCRTATRGGLAEGRDRAARRREGRAQRSVPVRQRQEVQEVSRARDPAPSPTAPGRDAR